jgi:hypothetical protein
MNKTIKEMLPIILVVVGLNVIIYFGAKNAGNDLENKEAKYKAKIGKKFILDKDTLTIIDYSFIMSNFTLSNGVKINSSIILKTK